MFDQSGTYLAVGGSDIRVYICKQWSEVLNFTGEEENVLRFSYMDVILCLLCVFFTFFFPSNCRSFRIGDGSGLWRERSVLVLSRNGQKSQILQFVERNHIRRLKMCQSSAH